MERVHNRHGTPAELHQAQELGDILFRYTRDLTGRVVALPIMFTTRVAPRHKSVGGFVRTVQRSFFYIKKKKNQQKKEVMNSEPYEFACARTE